MISNRSALLTGQPDMWINVSMLHPSSCLPRSLNKADVHGCANICWFWLAWQPVCRNQGFICREPSCIRVDLCSTIVRLYRITHGRVPHRYPSLAMCLCVPCSCIWHPISTRMPYLYLNLPAARLQHDLLFITVIYGQ